jgi:hypothetical protein
MKRLFKGSWMTKLILVNMVCRLLRQRSVVCVNSSQDLACFREKSWLFVPQSAPTRAVKCSPHFGRDFSALGQVLFYCVNPSDSPTPRPKLQLSSARGPSNCFAPYTCLPCKTLLRCPAIFLRCSDYSWPPHYYTEAITSPLLRLRLHCCPGWYCSTGLNSWASFKHCLLIIFSAWTNHAIVDSRRSWPSHPLIHLNLLILISAPRYGPSFQLSPPGGLHPALQQRH